MTSDEGDGDEALLAGLRRLLDRLNQVPDLRTPSLTPLGERVQRHLGTDPSRLPVVRDEFPQHRLVDADIALEKLAEQDPHTVILGVSGGQEKQHENLAGLLRNRWSVFGDDGAVEYGSAATGPRSSQRIILDGLRLLRWRDTPVVVLQRGADPRSGRNAATLEVLAPSDDIQGSILSEIHRLMTAHSVVRGQVVSFTDDPHGMGVGGMTFHDRPQIESSDVVLPDGVLERIRGHVVGIGENAEALQQLGQHLKRGLLLYGPPGTGKTLTLRHLLHETPGVTAVLLQGRSLGHIGEATRLARAMSPAILALEDVDLVAGDRTMFGGPQPLLFEILDALDGLDGDADVAFVLTTNRADILEPALAARPGRIDLAVEIPLPDASARRALFAMYAKQLGVSQSALDAAADRAEGVTASFAKELARRAALRAVDEGRAVQDEDLDQALTDMLASYEGIARVLFGGIDAAAPHDHGPSGGGASFGWFAQQPGGGTVVDQTLGDR